MRDSKPLIRPRSQHSVSRRDIDPDAKKVLYRLADAGHAAYLVGGSVRDLLLGRRPKDFDIATDAHPNRIKKLFRNCFLIGRRFRLAHIKFGDKIIETATFRRQPKMDADPDDPEANLFHKDDNTFGTEEEDARRRDFTINGLFYDIESFEVVDYVGGLADIEARPIRSIGDPDIRFREDPVRMVRAVRFAARLGFDIEHDTYDAIHRHFAELEKASPARMLEEIYKLFTHESSEPAFRLLHESRILGVMFPELADYLADCRDPRMWDYLRALDTGSRITGPPTGVMMLGALFYDYVRFRIDQARARDDDTPYGDLVHDLIEPAARRYNMPKRLVSQLVKSLADHPRFDGTRKRRFSKPRFVSQHAFPETLALYEIHLEATGGDHSRIEPWLDLFEEHVHPLSGSSPRGERAAPKPKSRRRGGRRRGGRSAKRPR